MPNFIKRLVLAGACTTMIACTSMQPLTLEATQLRSELAPGDELEIATSSGQQLHFKLQSIDDNGLHGGGQDVAYSDIRSIQRKQFSAGRTALLVLGVVAAGAAIGGGGGGGSGGGGY